ncbi:sulfurtransferase [Myroides sp. LJL116]
MNYNTLISPKELSNWMQDSNKELVVLDASASEKEYQKYLQSHIKGARFVFNEDLSRPVTDASLGGRHPLPSIEAFEKTLQKLGITKNSTVVIYDNQGGANAASRFWWMLQSVGHTQSYVLDGGYQAALKYGIAMQSQQDEIQQVAPYGLKGFMWPTIEIDQIVDNQNKKDNVLIDVRQGFRYDGISEPIDLLAGHIPGAVNICFDQNLDAEGNFKSKQDLRQLYHSVVEGCNAVNIQCGSGVTACHTILALVHAGFDLPTLYVGSWSEYSRNNFPKITKE